MLPKHNAEGPARAAAEVQVDQARQGGRDVGTVVSERERDSLMRFTQFDAQASKSQDHREDFIDTSIPLLGGKKRRYFDVTVSALHR